MEHRDNANRTILSKNERHEDEEETQTHLWWAGLDRVDPVQENGKKFMLLFIHQMPLLQWEPNLTKNLRHYLLPKHKGSIVQMNISTELKDLSCPQSWLHALIKAYKTLFCNAEINKKIINNFRGCRCNLQMQNLLVFSLQKGHLPRLEYAWKGDFTLPIILYRRSCN